VAKLTVKRSTPQPPRPEPEPPDWLKGLLWVWHQITEEGAVIRKAPGSFLLMAAVVALLVFFYTRAQFEEQSAGKDATIQSDEAAIKYANERLAAYEGKPSEAAPGQSRVKFGYFQRNDISGRYGINIYATNVGAAPANNLVHADRFKIFDKPPTQADADAIFADMYKELNAEKRTPPDTETQPGDAAWWTEVPKDITIKQVDDEVVNGSKAIYAFVLYQYRDDETPPGKWRTTEVCQYTFRRDAMHSCSAHNHIDLHE
jgi:hypothetical protein